jgi:PBP1b-binding outer membrane lipoprotein LpoB
MLNKVKYLSPLLAALMLGACSSEPEWVEVYEQCKETVTAKSDEIKGIGADSEDAQSRAMAESMGNMAISMAMTACEMIRTSCEQDPEGATCRAYVEQGKQQ